MGQGRSSSLALLAIERTMVQSLEKKVGMTGSQSIFLKRNRAEFKKKEIGNLYDVSRNEHIPLFEKPAGTTGMNLFIQPLNHNV